MVWFFYTFYFPHECFFFISFTLFTFSMLLSISRILFPTLFLLLLFDQAKVSSNLASRNRIILLGKFTQYILSARKTVAMMTVTIAITSICDGNTDRQQQQWQRQFTITKFKTQRWPLFQSVNNNNTHTHTSEKNPIFRMVR